MTTKALRVEWDADKADINVRKHGVTFDEAVTALMDPLGLTVPDALHSEEEPRYVATGYSQLQRLLVVIYTDRGDAVRIVSAREATRREQKAYEQYA